MTGTADIHNYLKKRNIKGTLCKLNKSAEIVLFNFFKKQIL